MFPLVYSASKPSQAIIMQYSKLSNQYRLLTLVAECIACTSYYLYAVQHTVTATCCVKVKLQENWQVACYWCKEFYCMSGLFVKRLVGQWLKQTKTKA